MCCGTFSKSRGWSLQTLLTPPSELGPYCATAQRPNKAMEGPSSMAADKQAHPDQGQASDWRGTPAAQAPNLPALILQQSLQTAPGDP